MTRWFVLDEGRRKFLREIGSIVLGVLIALGLGAVASEIGWRMEVAEARQALSSELGEILGQARERARVEPCYHRRLDEIAAIIERGATDGRLPPVGRLGGPLHRTWSRGVWASTLNAETAAHFDRDTLDNLSGIYEFVDLISGRNARELDLWSHLYTIVGPGRAIGTDEIADLRATLSEARMTSDLLAGGAERMQQIADAYRLDYSREDVRKYGDLALAQYDLCQPIGTAPKSYGVGMLDGYPDRARAHPITRESIGLGKR